MYKVFISYRHVEPDQELAQYLAAYLQREGCSIFLDKQITVGKKWAEEIEKSIREANYFVVLLSKDSIVSDMVRSEIRLAHEKQSRIKDSLTILPVRLDYDGALPYDLSSFLDPIQYALWNKGDSFQDIGTVLIAAIFGKAALPLPHNLENGLNENKQLSSLADTVNQGPPLPVADIRLSLDTGTVKHSSPFYIRRESDAEIELQLESQGATTIVKGPRQVGKSSLLARAHALARKKGNLSIYLDFQLMDDQQFVSLDTLLRNIAIKLWRESKLYSNPTEFWDNSLGAKNNLTYYIEESLLNRVNSPVYIFFDEADRVFSFSFRNDFFSMIRGWHNSRATSEAWENFNLVIAHSTDPTFWIQDINQSPFNVGTRITLQDFTFEQIIDLNERHGNPLKSESEILQLLQLLGGHPFLTRQALYSLSSNHYSAAQLNSVAAHDRGPFGDHLRRLMTVLVNRPELHQALLQVLRFHTCDDENQFQSLLAMGMVRGELRSHVTMRCELYDHYFRQYL
jgi:hypothetical protein